MSTVVIKVGGALLDSRDNARVFMNDIAQLQREHNVVVVHGGGNTVEGLLAKLGLATTKIDGLRVTPHEHIDYVVGALAGTTNKRLCGFARSAGLRAVGLSLGDGDMTSGEYIRDELGAVGKVTAVSPSLLTGLLAGGYLPVVSSIGMTEDGNLLNVNADQAATAVAALLNADLYLLSDVPGVLDGSGSLIPELSEALAEHLVTEGVIRDGMLVKVQAAQHAATSLKRTVTIGSWKSPKLLIQNTSGHNAGTSVCPLSTSGEQ